MPHPRPGLLTLLALCLGILAVGLIAENFSWLTDLETVVQRSPSRFPSSQVVSPAELERAASVLSVYTEARYLDDPGIGLLANPMQVGRDWEHPATVSYFEEGGLQFASNIGLRMHGGTSRTGSPVQSFRLYFRREYGSAQFRPGTLFDGKGDPLTRLITHNDLRMNHDGTWWHLVNPLAFDIAREIGALAPETQPAAFVLNGEPQGLYVLTEHVRDEFLESRFGHDNFERADGQRRRHWMDTELPRRAPFTAADLSNWIDVESLSRWFVSIVFCATSDPFQGVIFREMTQSTSRWFWVNWDMDHSFMDFYGYIRVASRHDTFETTLRKGSFESRVLTQLIDRDPEYREYLAGLFLDALNYQLTPLFLGDRYQYYRNVAERYRLEDDRYLEALGEFLAERPATVRRLMVKYLQLEPLARLRLDGPAGVGFRINGHTVASDFIGWYLPGTDVRVELDQPLDALSHWLVNGERVASAEVTHRVAARTLIRPQFDPVF